MTVAEVMEKEKILVKAIASMGLNSERSARDSAKAWREYEASCRANRVCGNLRCWNAAVSWCRFCDEHCADPRHVPHCRVCDTAYPDDDRSCDGAVDAVVVVTSEGSRIKGCIRHAATMLARLYGATVVPGTVPGAVADACWLAGIPVPEYSE